MLTDRRSVIVGSASLTMALVDSRVAASKEAQTLHLPSPGLSFVLRAEVEIGAPIELGHVDGLRKRVIPITGGQFNGPGLTGVVLPGGADWQALRDDGTTDILARYTLRVDDSTIISVTNPGYRFGPPEVLARLAHGDDVDPAEYYFRTTPRFEVAESSVHAWLGRHVFVCTAARFATRVMLDIFRVT